VQTRKSTIGYLLWNVLASLKPLSPKPFLVFREFSHNLSLGMTDKAEAKEITGWKPMPRSR
jgi:hypothetical protein